MTAERFRTLISTILIVGVVSSATLIAIGLVASFLVGWEGSLVGAAPGIMPLTDFVSMPGALLELRPIAITQLGLVILLATPVVRVAASMVAFLMERDWLYAVITLTVLVILCVSIFGLR